MRLTTRLFLGTLGVVGVLAIWIILVVDIRLRESTLDESRHELERQAWLVAALWTADSNAELVARKAAMALGHRVTLLRHDGRAVGDSELALTELVGGGDFSQLPEVAQALRDSVGWDIGQVPSGPELRVAVQAPQGVVRLTSDAADIDAAFDSVRRGVAGAALVATALAALVAWLFARTLVRPVAELGDVARGLAAGDLTRRPSLTARGEVGDLADALHRLAEQLAGRLEALKAEEALLGALSEALSEGVVAVDRRAQVIRINATGRRLLRVHDKVPFAIDQLPRDRALRDALAAALRGEGTDTAEVIIRGHTLMLAARPLPDGGAVLALYDLTQIRKLETVRRDFVANVSHELRTPLTIVGGFAETLAEEELPTEQRRLFAAKILVNARRMQRIVDDLLDLSRIESGGWVPLPESLDMGQFAGEAITAAGQAASEKGVLLTAEVAPDATSVHADPTALRQILGNLVHNAVRYTAPGGKVHIFTESRADGVLVGVRDTGSGIAAEHLPRIFERFYRADPARSRDEGGTGLGLAIVRHLVEAHGGRIQADSTPGRGTTITALFPRPTQGTTAPATDGSPAR